MDGLTLCHSVLQAMAFQRMRKRREWSFSCLTRLGWQQWKACDKYWQIMCDLARLFGSGHHRADEVGETWCDIHELPETQQRLERSTQKCDINSISVWEIALPDQSPPPGFFPCILCLLFIFFPGTEVSRFLFTCALHVLVVFFPSVLLALPVLFPCTVRVPVLPVFFPYSFRSLPFRYFLCFGFGICYFAVAGRGTTPFRSWGSLREGKESSSCKWLIVCRMSWQRVYRPN